MGTKVAVPSSDRDRRDGGRRQVGSVMPVHMQNVANGKNLRCRIHDVSPKACALCCRNPSRRAQPWCW